ncbi:MAG: OmpH family outer membrane protein [Chitinispirillia bacterium]|nr:OmpH family outer membrane protein [Chitinispirillia bacterium]MCL2241178.1 OmpH family outer membrane protein [Chitinispirillia bacterium]
MMRGFKAAVLMFFAAGAINAASAQLKIGSVNSEKILTQFEGAKVAQDRFNKDVAAWEQEMSKQRRAINELGATLEKQAMLLSAERKKKLEDSLQQMLITHNKFQQDKLGPRGEVQTKLAELMKPIVEKVNKIIDKIAKDEQFDFILDERAGGVLYVKPAHDLTDRVLAQLAKEK